MEKRTLYETVKKNSPYALLAQSIFFVAIGISALASGEAVARITSLVIRILLIALGAVNILTFITGRKKKLVSQALTGLSYIVFALLLSIMPNFFLSSVVRIIGIVSLINALSRFFYAAQCYYAKESGTIRALIAGAVSLAFFIAAMVSPLSQMSLLYTVMGIYLIFFGLILLGDFTRELLAWNDNIKRYIKIPLPVLFASFIPLKVLGKINKSVKSDKPDDTLLIKTKNSPDEKLLANFEIFIHLAADCAFGMGHCDLSVENTVYSFGCYDTASTRFAGTYSDGVLVRASKDEYLDHCVKHEKKSLVGFGIALSQEQLSAVFAQLDNLMKKSYPWLCARQLGDADAKDPASLLYDAAGSSFYKFTGGKYKKYFVLSTNCVGLVDFIAGAAGLNLRGNNGIITPGTYMAFLESLFMTKNTCVIERNVYR